MSAPANPVEYRSRLKRRPFSPAWRTFAKGLYGLPLTESERPLWVEMTGGIPDRPGVGWLECVAIGGRGSGKDDTFASLADFEAYYGGHEVAAAPGQRIPVQIICPLRNQAAGSLGFCKGEARDPLNLRLVRKENADSIELRSGVVIQVQTADEVAVTGDTLASLWLNEFTLMPGESSSSPIELIEWNVRPAMRRVTGAPPKRILRSGSAYIRSGYPWTLFNEHFGRESDVLVVSGSTEFFNPNIDHEWLEGERRRLGGALYAMHFESEWREAIISGFFPGDAIGTAVKFGNATLPHVGSDPLTITADAAFSENGDRFGVAVASHRSGAYHDALNRRDAALTTVHYAAAWKPDRSPREMAARLRDEVCVRFNERRILIDQHSASAFAQLCRDVGLYPEVVAWTGGEKEGSKADRYRSFRTAMIAGELHLPDVPELTSDLRACRSTMLPGGGERIEVPRTTRGHGDILAAVVMAASTAAKRGERFGGFGPGWFREAREFSSALRAKFGGAIDAVMAGVATSQSSHSLDTDHDARMRAEGWQSADGSLGTPDNNSSGWTR